MTTSAKAGNNEILNDYKMLEKMAQELASHQVKLKAVRKAVAKKIKSDLEFGIIENLDTVIMHMGKASKELEKARKELRMI